MCQGFSHFSGFLLHFALAIFKPPAALSFKSMGDFENHLMKSYLLGAYEHFLFNCSLWNDFIWLLNVESRQMALLVPMCQGFSHFQDFCIFLYCPN